MGADETSDRIVGRRPELTVIDRAIARTMQGRGGLVILAGEPGIGKTTLAEEAADRAGAAGARVVWSSCWEGGGAPAYWPWQHVLKKAGALPGAPDTAPVAARLGGDDLPGNDLPANDLAGVGLPGAGHPRDAADRPDDRRADATDPAIRLALFDDVASALVAAASPPLVAVIDDIHWAGVPSLLLLRYVAREARTAGLLVLATSRESDPGIAAEAAAILTDLRRDASTLLLGGLSQADVGELLGDRPGVDQATIADLFRRTSGNPLFVRELARLLTTGAGPSSVPENIRAVLQRRLQPLDAGTHAVLRVAAAAGDQIEPQLLAAATARTEDDVLAAIEPARRLQVVVHKAEGALAFAHALVREVLYDSTPLEERAEHHAAIGTAIASSSSSDPSRWSEIARHLMLSPRTRATGADFAVRAAQRAMDQTAYEQAAVLLEKAIAACPDQAGRVTDLLTMRGDALSAAGQAAEARECYVRAATAASEDRDGPRLARAALGLAAGATGFEVTPFDHLQLQLLQDALALLGEDDSSLRSFVLARLSVAWSMNADDSLRRDLAVEAVAMARRLDDGRALGQALAAHCDAMAFADYATVRRDEATEIISIAGRTGDRPLELLGRRLRLVALLELGDLDGVDAEITAFAATAAVLRRPIFTWYVHLWRGMRALMSGRLSEAASETAEARAVGEAAESFNAEILTTAQAVFLDVEHGNGTDAVALMRSYDGQSAVGESLVPTIAALTALTGDAQECRRWMDRLGPSVAGDMPRDSEWLPAISGLCYAAWTLRDRELGASLLEALRPHTHLWATEGIGAMCHGPVSYPAALAAWVAGEHGEAGDLFGDAERRCRQASAALILAHVLRHHALALDELGDRPRAARLAGEAAALYRQMGIDTRAASLELVLDHRPAADRARPQPTGDASLFLEGDVWTAQFEGQTARLKDAKGIHDIARLLAAPGVEVHVLDLAGAGVVSSGATPDTLIDPAAREAFRRRVDDLQGEIDDAEAFGDTARADRARHERDRIARELSAALGLHGRGRSSPDEAERARKAVTRRIRLTVDRIEAAHPALGRHLAKSIRTGTYCSYMPESPVDWEV